MKNLDNFLENLKTEQRRLIVDTAALAILPSDNTLRKIADLENSIAAVEAVSREMKLAKTRRKAPA